MAAIPACVRAPALCSFAPGAPALHPARSETEERPQAADALRRRAAAGAGAQVRSASSTCPSPSAAFSSSLSLSRRRSRSGFRTAGPKPNDCWRPSWEKLKLTARPLLPGPPALPAGRAPSRTPRRARGLAAACITCLELRDPGAAGPPGRKGRAARRRTPVPGKGEDPAGAQQASEGLRLFKGFVVCC